MFNKKYKVFLLYVLLLFVNVNSFSYAMNYGEESILSTDADRLTKIKFDQWLKLYMDIFERDMWLLDRNPIFNEEKNKFIVTEKILFEVSAREYSKDVVENYKIYKKNVSKCNVADDKQIAIRKEDLATKIKNHQLWMQDYKFLKGKSESSIKSLYKLNLSIEGVAKLMIDPKRALFCGVKFKGNDFYNIFEDKRKLILDYAIFSESYFDGVKFTDASLRYVDFQYSILDGVVINRSELYLSKFSGSYIPRLEILNSNIDVLDLSDSLLARFLITGSNIRFIRLPDINSESLFLKKSNTLRSEFSPTQDFKIKNSKINTGRFTELTTSKLQLINNECVSCYFNLSDMSNITLDSKLHTTSGLTRSLNLSYVNFEDLTNMVLIRNDLRKNGDIKNAKQLTSGIYKFYRSNLPTYGINEFVSDIILGGKITNYGADITRPISILFYLIIVFSFIYMFIISRKDKSNGIWKKYSDERISYLKIPSDEQFVTYEGNIYVLLTPVYFSMLSAFHFGWRNLNLGNWLIKLQNDEYILKANGWARTISGLQSFISLYLVAVMLVNYFGSPYE